MFALIGSANAQGASDPLPSCVPNPKGTFTGHLETRKSPDAPGGRTFYVVGEDDVIIFDLPPGAEAAEPAITSALASKDSVQLSWSGSYVERDPIDKSKLEVYTGAKLRLSTGTKSMSCLPALDPTPMSQLGKKPDESI